MAVSVCEKACLSVELTWELSVMRSSLYLGFYAYAVLYGVHDFVYLNRGTELVNLGNTESRELSKHLVAGPHFLRELFAVRSLTKSNKRGVLLLLL